MIVSLRSLLTIASQVLLLAGLLSPHIHAQVTPPATPAGQALDAYLHALNDGNPATAQAFIDRYHPRETAAGLQNFASQTGGFTLLSIESSKPASIGFLVQGRADHMHAAGSLRLASINPPRISSITVRILPPGAHFDDSDLSAATRTQTINDIAKHLTEFYVFPDIGAKMIAAMRQHAAHGDYNSLTDGNDFADRLTTDLRDVSHDKHLFVGYQPYVTAAKAAAPGPPPPPSPEDEANFRKSVQHDNCAFTKVEILPGNIGYISFSAFPPPAFCADTATAAMNFVAHTDALIFDLRDNHGGDPSMVQYLASYLFVNPTHVNDLYNRRTDETHQYWTLSAVAGTRFLDKPVYVLTSHNTFSGGEEFTYDLKTQKRATIVGETTGGGAHPMSVMPAGNHFVIAVPEGRPINPVTHTDWEGTGVEPDVKTSAADALATAQKLAHEKIQPR